MAPDTLPIGATIAGYMLEGVLGRGGMAVVYRAKHPARAESVALKVIAPTASWDTGAQELFEQEARLAAAVVHRHILPVYEAGRHGDHPFVAMRMEACDLGALLRSKGRLSASHTVALVSQVASALDAAHAHGLVHRDIKPQNVLFGDEEGRECAYVADFGVARAAFSGTELLSDALVGTIGYAAPEQIRGDAVDQRSDVYALGCLVHELLTGRVPFGGRGSLATLWAHLHDDAPAPSLLRPDLPSGVDAVVRRALAKSPGERYGSAGAFAGVLAEAVNGRRPQVRAEPRESAPLPTGTVTFLFTDVEGSTRLLHELGAEAYAEELAEHRRLVREACSARGGVEVDTQGDAFFFAFTSAPEALAAADEAQAALRATAIRVRFGIHSGQPHLTSEGYVGIDVHRAARIAASAHGGQIVLSRMSTELIAPGEPGAHRPELVSLGAHRLKDFSEPVTIFQLGDGSFPPLKTIANSNLPTPVSSFLGREAELQEADLLLEDARLLTVHGPGGQGKTRFSLELARRCREERFSDYEDGVFACFLAPLRDPALILPTIAKTLSVSEQLGRTALESLCEHLHGKKVLVLVDNLEHVLASARELSDLVAACPGLTLLLTSRELLRLSGETAYELPPLAEDEGVTLFCERAQVEPSVTIAEICARLEGLPLAIELAAARLRLLSPEQLLERLAQRLDLLKGSRDADPRQQTLRATIQWSSDLLTPAEQTLFTRLSVFAGGCTLEAAEEVCEADLDTLESLLDKSLVRRIDGRIWMLETIREFAGERLVETGDQRVTQTRHLAYFGRIASSAELHFDRPEQDGWLRTLDADHDNLRAALSFALAESGFRQRALAIATAVWRYWYRRAHIREGRRWLSEALRDSESADSSLRARALNGAGVFAQEEGDLEIARALQEESLRVAREAGDASAEANALGDLAAILDTQGARELAMDMYKRSEALFVELGDAQGLAVSLMNRGSSHRAAGELDVAMVLLERALSQARAAAVHMQIGLALCELAAACLEDGDNARARTLLREALPLVAGGIFCAWSLWLHAAEAAAAGLALRSARLAGAAKRRDRDTGSSLDTPDLDLVDRYLAPARALVGDVAFDSAWAEGGAMTVEEVVEYALARDAPSDGGRAPDDQWLDLALEAVDDFERT